MQQVGRIWLFLGPNGTGKTACALGVGDEDPSDKVDLFEWDTGSYRRASSALKHPDRVTVHRFRTPLTNIEDFTMGNITVGPNGAAPTPAYKLTGWQEVYGNFLKAYLKAIKGDGRPVIDTATRLWLAVRQSFLEQLQEATGNENARLDQLRYTEPNARMTQIAEAPERFGKDLILVAHEDTVFGTSQIKADGFKELPNMADIVVRFTLQDGKPVGTIWKLAEGGIELLNRQVEWPTLKKLSDLLDASVKVKKMGMSVPDTNEELLALAAGL